MELAARLVRHGTVTRLLMVAVLSALLLGGLTNPGELTAVAWAFIGLLSLGLLGEIALSVYFVQWAIRNPHPLVDQQVQAPTLRWRGPPRMMTIRAVRIGIGDVLAGVVLATAVPGAIALGLGLSRPVFLGAAVALALFACAAWILLGLAVAAKRSLAEVASSAPSQSTEAAEVANSDA